MALAVGVGCGGSKDDDTSVLSAPYMNILSPTPGEFIDEGVEVVFEAEGRAGSGALAELSEVVWTASEVDWTATGNPITVNDLPAGLYELLVTGLVEGTDVSSAVDLAVYAAQSQ
jgi:hypothetical protein